MENENFELLNRPEADAVIDAAREKFAGIALGGLITGIFSHPESYSRAMSMASARDQMLFEFIADESVKMSDEMLHRLCIDLAHICRDNQ